MKSVEIQTEPAAFSELQGKLEQLEAAFLKARDTQNSIKVKQLLDKLANRSFIFAFCGHFSAGKSSMINRLMGSEVLPSSPIPTSANVVTIGSGPSQAQVWRRDGSSFSVPLSELETLRRFAENGDEIESIRILHPTEFLPDHALLMDTPGIDSTDDAHRVATESALHLSDIVIYVMDYNHVQSEVNFGFTKTLKDRGKAVWLVVNQIDKHNAFELPFSDYARSVKEAFTAWGIEPDGIFYTTLKEGAHEYNQFPQLQEAIRALLEHKDPLLQRSVIRSALDLIEEHVRFVSAEKDKERKAYLETLPEVKAGSVQAQNLAADYRERILKLRKELEEMESFPFRLREEMQSELQSLIENAILTPFQTTELCGSYLESRRPGFRVGFLFSGNKTEQERANRLAELHADFTGKVAAGLEWHFKDLLVKIPERYGVRDESYANAVYNLRIEISPEMLAGWVKEGALASREYMYQYAKDIATEVKSLYRRAAADFVERAAELAGAMNSDRSAELKERLAEAEQYLQAAAGLENLEQLETAYRNELVDLFRNEIQSTDHLATLYSRVSRQVLDMVEQEQAASTETDLLASSHGISGDAPEKSLNEKFPAQAETIQSDRRNYKNQLVNAAAKLREAAGLISDIPGFHTIAAQMMERAERLDRNLFTVALFGAFSAGKSSFANAMMGDLVLPVSPNPTTATINKILPPNAEWPHSTVRVKLKSPADIAADIKVSLAILGIDLEGLTESQDGEYSRIFAEALGLISAMNPEEVPPNAKPHFSFLKAVEKGFSDIQSELGQELRTDMTTFRDYVAREDKACFVEWIELYYDCPLTRQGIMLIDTPGADSINARHTKVAFEYIKNADAVLFVTYYNHAFSNADREFLIQLGRVKDAFEMDKMFFLVNAADLAADEEELAEVVSHVRKNLVSCGISMPRIYPVSSQQALLARLADKGRLTSSAERAYRKITGTSEGEPLPVASDVLTKSGIEKFEGEFLSFTIEELTAVAVQSALAEIGRAAANLQEFIETAKEGEAERNLKRASLQTSLQNALSGIEQAETDSEIGSIEKEIDELLYYVKQRVFLRYIDAFNESFSSSVLRDDAKDIKKILGNCLQELIRFLAFDLGQEMRATAVRVEKQVNRSAGRIHERLVESVRTHLPGCQLEPCQYHGIAIPDFPEGLPNAENERFTDVMSFYKNAKDFFERDVKSKMREEMAKKLQGPVDAYLAEGARIVKAVYLEAFRNQVKQVKQTVARAANEYADGMLAALSMQVNIQELESAREHLARLR